MAKRVRIPFARYPRPINSVWLQDDFATTLKSSKKFIQVKFRFIINPEKHSASPLTDIGEAEMVMWLRRVVAKRA